MAGTPGDPFEGFLLKPTPKGGNYFRVTKYLLQGPGQLPGDQC